MWALAFLDFDFTRVWQIQKCTCAHLICLNLGFGALKAVKVLVHNRVSAFTHLTSKAQRGYCAGNEARPVIITMFQYPPDRSFAKAQLTFKCLAYNLPVWCSIMIPQLCDLDSELIFGYGGPTALSPLVHLYRRESDKCLHSKVTLLLLALTCSIQDSIFFLGLLSSPSLHNFWLFFFFFSPSHYLASLPLPGASPVEVCVCVCVCVCVEEVH